MNDIIPSTSTESASKPYRFSRGHWIIIALGVVAGLSWYTLNLLLPERCRGLTCCDASIFMRISEPPPMDVFFHSSSRAFGYAFYLSIFRYLTGNSAWFIPLATVVQVLVYFLSSIILFLALKRIGLRLPILALGLLLAHPTLTGISAITLTESLATSCFSITFALAILLTNTSTYFSLYSLLLGVMAGVLVALRPPITTNTLIVGALVGVSVLWSSYRNFGGAWPAIRRTARFGALYLLGFLPIYGHMISNCYSAHKEICVLPSFGRNAAIAESLNYNQAYARIWGLINKEGSFNWGTTDDRVFPQCDIKAEGAFEHLATCYLKNYTYLPRYFFRRLLGIVDNRHLNPYCALDTPVIGFWTIRVFSSVALIGLLAAAFLFFTPTGAGGWASRSFLLIPFLYLGVQLNLHTETRYIYPIVPFLFLLGISSLVNNIVRNRLLYVALLLAAGVLLWIYFHQVLIWDDMSLAKFKSR